MILTIQARNMAMEVAKATPDTPIPNAATSITSRTILAIVDTIRK